MSFIHVMIEHDDVEKPDSLQDVPAFQAFLADIADRCDVPRTRAPRPSSAASADLGTANCPDWPGLSVAGREVWVRSEAQVPPNG